MSTAKTISALILLLVLGGFYYFHEIAGKEEQSARELAASKFISIDPAKIGRIEFLPEKIVLEKTDTLWEIVSPVKTPADTDFVNALVARAGNVTRGRLVAEPAPQGDEKRQYGLDTGAQAVFSGNGEKQSIQTGAPNPAGDSVYAISSTATGVYLMNLSDKQGIFAGLFSLRDKSVFKTADIGGINKLAVKTSAGKLVLEKTGTGWQLDGKPADRDLVTQTVESLWRLKADSFPAENPDTAELEKFGLDPHRAAKITMQLKPAPDSGADAQPQAEVILAGKIEDSPAGKKIFVRRLDGGPVMTVSYDPVAPLFEIKSDTWLSNQITGLAPDSVDKIDLVFRNDQQETISLVKQPGGNWTAAEPAGMTVSRPAVEKFLHALSDTVISERIKTPTAVDASRGIQITLGADKNSESVFLRKSDDGKVTGTSSYLQSSFGLQSANSDILPVSAEYFADKRMFPVSADDVTSVTVETPAGKIVAGKSAGAWRMEKPAPGAARQDKIDELLNSIVAIEYLPAPPQSPAGGYGLEKDKIEVKIAITAVVAGRAGNMDKQPKRVEIPLGTKNNGYYYATAPDGKIVLAPAEKIDSILKSADSLAQKND